MHRSVFGRYTLRAVAVISWLVSIVWMVFEPGFEPLLAFLGGTASFLLSYAVAADSPGAQEAREKRERLRENVLVWSSSEAAGTGLPKNSLPVTTLYVSRPELEADLRSALLNCTIVSLEGPSGIGKTYSAAKALAELQSENERREVIYFDSQPELSTVTPLLLESTGQPSLRSALNYLAAMDTFLVFDDFKVLTPHYREFLQECVTYAASLRILIISRTRLNLVFPEHPGQVRQVRASRSFTKDQARLFLKKALAGEAFTLDRQDFEDVYESTGQGLPRALASFASASVRRVDERHYQAFFEADDQQHPLRKWSNLVLEGLTRQERGIVECVACMPAAINKTQLVSLYRQLHPVLCLLLPDPEKEVLGIVRDLVDRYVLELQGETAVTVHRSIREAVGLFPARMIRAHRLLARTYLARYDIRDYNPDRMPAQEMLDKWQAVYHSILGERYIQAANVLCEIYPFVSEADLEEGADSYLEELYAVLKGEVPWISYLLALRSREQGDLDRASTIIDTTVNDATPRMKVRLMTLKASVLADSGRTQQALELADLNIRVIQETSRRKDSRRMTIEYDPNLDRLLAWNLTTLSEVYAQSGEKEKAEAFALQAQEVRSAIPVKRQIARARMRTGA